MSVCLKHVKTRYILDHYILPCYIYLDLCYLLSTHQIVFNDLTPTLQFSVCKSFGLYLPALFSLLLRDTMKDNTCSHYIYTFGSFLLSHISGSATRRMCLY